MARRHHALVTSLGEPVDVKRFDREERKRGVVWTVLEVELRTHAIAGRAAIVLVACPCPGRRAS